MSEAPKRRDAVPRRAFLRDFAAGTIAFVAVGCTTSHRKAMMRRSPTSTTEGFSLGFGGRIDAGAVTTIRTKLRSTTAPVYVPEARAYVNPYPPAALARARSSYPSEVLATLETGLVVLYQRCTHLGCRVPWCESSQMFECPCHGAKFNRVGERHAGPAPRGMDHFVTTIENGRLVIDTGTILHGTADGTDTTRQTPAGPFCV